MIHFTGNFHPSDLEKSSYSSLSEIIHFIFHISLFTEATLFTLRGNIWHFIHISPQKNPNIFSISENVGRPIKFRVKFCVFGMYLAALHSKNHWVRIDPTGHKTGLTAPTEHEFKKTTKVSELFLVI